MAKKGGAPENLDPVRTKEEAKKRGRNGGIKSGEVRRNKRDAKNAMNLLLNMAAKGQIKDNLVTLGIDPEDQTNMVALQARLFTMAMGGNLQAYDRLIKISGNDPEENRKERESRAADKRRDRESEARVSALEHGDSMGRYAVPGDEEDESGEKDDVIIFMPYTERDEKTEAKADDVLHPETGDSAPVHENVEPDPSASDGASEDAPEKTAKETEEGASEGGGTE